MDICIIDSCDNEASSGKGHKYCSKCYFKKRNQKRRRQRGYFRIISHYTCAQSGNPVNATHTKICSVCLEPTIEGDEIIFQTICSNCAKLKPHGALIPRSQPPDFDDFCVECKEIIPSAGTNSKSKKRNQKIQEEPEIDNRENSVTIKRMKNDLSRILNGVIKIKRDTLMIRLIDECGYSRRDASIAVSSVLGLYSYSEEDGMIFFKS